MNEALKKDREQIDGRPIFVSKCDPDKHTRQHSFKYSTSVEKNKLFVKGILMYIFFTILNVNVLLCCVAVFITCLFIVLRSSTLYN